MNQKKVLVTGGLGFVGSNLVDFLIDTTDYEVVVIDNLCSESSSRDYMRNDVEYWIDDIRNINHTKYANQKFDLIFHLAALARIQPSFKDPCKYFSIDILGTAEVCEYAKNMNAKLIYAGSSSAYGGPMLNPYAFAKFTGEQICELYHKIYNLSVVTARFFNVYGKRQPTTGSYATVIGIFENQMKNGKKLTVTGDGEQRRDFTHIDDIVRGFFAISQIPGKAQVLNIGSGINYSINEVANMFGGKIEYIPSRPGEAKNTLADIQEIQSLTKWKPESNLRDYILFKKMNNFSNC